MAKETGKTVALVSMALAAGVLVAAGIALRERALEWWYLGKLTSAEESARAEGVEGLAKLELVGAIPRLLALLRKDDGTGVPRLRDAANPPHVQQALQKLVGPKALPVMSELLRHREESFRLWSAGTLPGAHSAAKSAVPALLRALDDASPLVSLAAGHSLLSLEPERWETVEAIAEAITRVAADPRSLPDRGDLDLLVVWRLAVERFGQRLLVLLRNNDPGARAWVAENHDVPWLRLILPEPTAFDALTQPAGSGR